MPSLTEFKSPYDFAGLKVWCDFEREARWGFAEAGLMYNITNKVRRGPDFTDAGNPTFRASILNGYPISRFAANEYWYEGNVAGSRQAALGVDPAFIQWMYESPLMMITVQRITNTFAAARGVFGWGDTSDGVGIRTNTTPKWEFAYEETGGGSNNTVLTKTPVQNQWEILMWSWTGGVNGTMRVGITEFWEDAEIIDLSATGFDPDAGLYPGRPWRFGSDGVLDTDGGEVACWAIWSHEPTEKAWDGMLRWAGTKYGITLS